MFPLNRLVVAAVRISVSARPPATAALIVVGLTMIAGSSP